MRVLATGHQGYLGNSDVLEPAATYHHQVRRRLLVVPASQGSVTSAVRSDLSWEAIMRFFIGTDGPRRRKPWQSQARTHGIVLAAKGPGGPGSYPVRVG